MRLKKAQDALRQAEESLKSGKPEALVRHQAYLAGRQAQIAKEQTNELRDRKEVEQGQAERNRVLLEARTTEATLAEAAAARAKGDAATQAAQAATARDQLAAASEEAARLRAELEGLQAKQTDRGMVLTLGDVLFDTGQATIRAGAMLTIEKLAAFLRDKPTMAVMIEGHTDSMGGDEYNLALSQRRADAVTGALTSRGVALERVHSRGLGKGYPTASNETASGRQQNRRVEIIFSDAKGQFAPTAQRLPAR